MVNKSTKGHPSFLYDNPALERASQPNPEGGNIHTGQPDCCADCELQEAMRLGRTPLRSRSPFTEAVLRASEGRESRKRTWFISYSWSAYYAGDQEWQRGYGNVYHHQHCGHNIAESDIRDLEEKLSLHHRPTPPNPADFAKVVILNIVEIDPE